MPSPIDPSEKTSQSPDPSPQELEPPRGLADKAVALCLGLTALGATLRVFTGTEASAWLAICALLGFCLVGWTRFGRREILLLTAAGILAGLEIRQEADPGPALFDALDRAAFLAAFMMLIGVLRNGAASSRDVVECGRWLTTQPPSRRYGSIAVGSHFAAVLLNVGALTLLSPLILAGVRESKRLGDSDAVAEIKTRRQFSAHLRGFATAITWAPTTVTQAVLASLLPGSDHGLVVAGGAGFAVLVFLLGLAEDNIRHRGLARAAAARGGGRRAPLPAPGRALLGVGAVCGGLALGAFSISAAAEVATVPALMLTAPIVTLIWIFLQNRDRGARVAWAETGRRGGGILSRGLPESAPEAFVLAVAGFIGAMLSALAPDGAIAAGLEDLPPILLLALPPLIIAALVQLALSPIVFAVFFGHALAGAGPLPVEGWLLILSLAGGWALALTIAPFTSGALVLSRVSGIASTTLTYRWNWLYTLLAYLMLVAWLMLLHYAT